MAIVAKPFKAVRPGDVYPSEIAKGEEVEGRLAEIAELLECLAEDEPAAPAKAPEKKPDAPAPAKAEASEKGKKG